MFILVTLVFWICYKGRGWPLICHWELRSYFQTNSCEQMPTETGAPHNAATHAIEMCFLSTATPSHKSEMRQRIDDWRIYHWLLNWILGRIWMWQKCWAEIGLLSHACVNSYFLVGCESKFGSLGGATHRQPSSKISCDEKSPDFWWNW